MIINFLVSKICLELDQRIGQSKWKDGVRGQFRLVYAIYIISSKCILGDIPGKRTNKHCIILDRVGYLLMIMASNIKQIVKHLFFNKLQLCTVQGMHSPVLDLERPT